MDTWAFTSWICMNLEKSTLITFTYLYWKHKLFLTLIITIFTSFSHPTQIRRFPLLDHFGHTAPTFGVFHSIQLLKRYNHYKSNTVHNHWWYVRNYTKRNLNTIRHIILNILLTIWHSTAHPHHLPPSKRRNKKKTLHCSLKLIISLFVIFIITFIHYFISLFVGLLLDINLSSHSIYLWRLNCCCFT
jgi:hypothetical protein